MKREDGASRLSGDARKRGRAALVLGLVLALCPMRSLFAVVIMAMVFTMMPMRLEQLTCIRPLVLFTGAGQERSDGEGGGDELGLHAWQY